MNRVWTGLFVWFVGISTLVVRAEDAILQEGLPVTMPLYLVQDGQAVEGPFVPGGRVGSQGPLTVQWADEADDEQLPALQLGWHNPTGWVGWVWLYPDTNAWEGAAGAVDLRSATQLVVVARGERGGEWVEFKMGMLRELEHGDVDSAGTTTGRIPLAADWQTYRLPLEFLSREHIVSGFAVIMAGRRDPVRCFIRDVYYE